MDLTLQSPGEHHYIHSISEKGIRVADQTYTGPVIISAGVLLTDWPVRNPEDLNIQHLDKILQLDPELVLIGTGKRQSFLAPDMLMVFYRRSVGVETMSTQAACRTFNVLVSEGRNVVAALMPITE